MRPPRIDAETLEQITAALNAGTSQTAVCRTFKIPRSTLIGTLQRMGWTGPTSASRNGDHAGWCISTNQSSVSFGPLI
jgi:hypothetical protein